jgi:hypothetical protein
MMSGILHADETLCTAADERLAIAVWHGEPTLHHMNLLEDMVRERVRLYASNILLVIVEQPVLPAEASRARMTEVMVRYKENLAAIGVVIEVEGLFGMALRTLGRGVVVASRTRTPTTFASSVAEAVDNMGQAFNHARLEPTRVLQSVHQIRARYASSIPPAPRAELPRA